MTSWTIRVTYRTAAGAIREEAWLACERWLDLVYAVAGRESAEGASDG